MIKEAYLQTASDGITLMSNDEANRMIYEGRRKRYSCPTIRGMIILYRVEGFTAKLKIENKKNKVLFA